MSFSVIHDLSTLSEAERQQYLRDASQYFGLDPNLNALDLIWMNNTDGMRRLVAYARRGTTDLLREIHQINVLSVTMATGPGFVSFTAIAKNLKGRQEIAVGAAGTDGLKGDKLAASVATAQTRALRRVTLQFIGGGLLDESEIGDNTMTDINRLPVSLSSIATAPVQPVVDPNADAGKDVTLESRLAAGEKGVPKIPDAPDTRHAVFTGDLSGKGGLPGNGGLQAPAPFSAGSIIPTVLSSPVQPIPEGVGVLEEPKRFIGTATLVTAEGALGSFPAIFDNNNNLVSVDTKGEESKRKRRKKVVDDSVPEELGIEPTHHEPYVSPNAGIPESHRTTTSFKVGDMIEMNGVPCEVLASGTIEKKIQQIVGEINAEYADKPIPQYPTDDQEKEFRSRLGVFTNGVLKEGGMTDGIIWRVRKYTKHLCPDALIDNGKMKLTVAEWTKLLFALEGINASDGPKGLVQTINEVAEKA